MLLICVSEIVYVDYFSNITYFEFEFDINAFSFIAILLLFTLMKKIIVDFSIVYPLLFADLFYCWSPLFEFD